jgi:signal transduction histidine kinase
MRLGLGGRLTLSVLGATAVALALLTVGFNLLLGARLDHDANSVAVARASGELSALKLSSGHIALGETPDAAAVDTPVWVFEGTRAVEQPRADAAAEQAALALANGPRRYADAPGGATRLYALPVVAGARRVGTVISGVSLAPYRQTRRTALLASAVLAALVLSAVALAARWLISRSLRTVGEMTRQAAEWSERDLDRRFALGEPRDELTQLAATLDGLLDRLAAALRHEQLLTAELSHELRTPLAHIAAEAQYALRHAREEDEYRAGFEQVLQGANHMGRTLETLMTAARAEHGLSRTRADADACAEAAVRAARPLAGAAGVDLDLTARQAGLRVAADCELVERTLGPLLENACRHARRRVTLTVEAAGSGVVFAVEDDGPGVPLDQAQAIFEPGYKGASTEQPADAPTGGISVATGATVSSAGAGLGLALARRLARASGGDVTCAPAGGGGRFVVRLPRA